MTIVLVNEQAKELTVLDKNGIDWSSDLIGGFSDVKRIDPNDNAFGAIWEMDEEQFNWFEELIELLDRQRDLEKQYSKLPSEYYEIAIGEETRDAVQKQIAWLEENIEERKI